MVNSHVHLIPEDTDEYVDALIARMGEHDIRASVLFGSQCEQCAGDEEVRNAVARYPDRFIPFLTRSLDIEDERSLQICLSELDSGFWQGVGEIFLDCSDDQYVRWTDREGKERVAVKPVPEHKEEHPLYKGIFEFCGKKKLPVLVHCMDATVMARSLEKFKATTFIWAHVDHGFYRDVGIELMREYPNLYCEFGVEFRFKSRKLLSGQGKPLLLDHIDRWRRTCREFPNRVIWGTDLYTWNDLCRERFAEAMRAWAKVTEDFDPELKQAVTEQNILRLLNMA